MKLSVWSGGCILLGILVGSISFTDAECDSKSYNVPSVPSPGTDPDPTTANTGVAFFPECETNNRKYFCVKSSCDPVIFLSPSPTIENDGDDYYAIRLDDSGVISIYRNGQSGTPVSTTDITDADTTQLISDTTCTDLYVAINPDDTIHIGIKNGAELISWKDTTGRHDINYILVQDYNDDGTCTSEWQFCEGDVMLLTSIDGVTTDSTGTGDPAADSSNLIDDETNNGGYDGNFCYAVDIGGPGEDVWWMVDLGAMYNIKAVSVLNTNVGTVVDLEDTEIRIGSCLHGDGEDDWDITDNAMCGSAYSAGEAGVNDWILRECKTQYYGQYVYIYKPGVTGGLVGFALCEVQVWGQVIPDEDKPKVGFTANAVMELEGDDPTDTLYTVTVEKTDGSAGHPTCLEFDIVRVDSDAVGQGTSNRMCPDPDFDYDEPAETLEIDPADADDILTYSPTDESTKSFADVEYQYDKCVEPDEQFGYKIVPVTSGLLAGDADDNTYDEITFTILNDDVTYCWEDVTISELEGKKMITAVLTRTGYTDKASTAVVDTVVDTAMGDTAMENIDFIPLEDYEVNFDAGQTTSENVVITIVDDDCMEEEDKQFTIMIDAAATDGEICKMADGTTVIDKVMAMILDDDAMFRFLDNDPDAGDADPREYTITETERTKEVVVERIGFLDNAVSIGVQTQPWIDDPSVAASTEDYVQFSETLTIPAGISTGSVTVTVVDDNEVEPQNGASIAEIFRLVLFKNPSTLDDCVLDTPDMAMISIIDNDCCWSMVNDALEVREDKGPVIATVLCERPKCDPGCPEMSRSLTTTYSIGSSGITDGTAAGSDDFTSRQDTSLTLPAVTGTSTQTSNTISVDIKNDIIKEDTEKFEITLTNSNDGEIKEPSSTTVTVIDDDVLVSLNCEVTSDVQENAGHLTVTLQRTGDLSEPDYVLLFTNPVTASDGKDYTGINVMKKFNAMESTITHEIPITDDTEYEVDEEFLVRIRPYSDQTDVDAVNNVCTWTIKDDDCAFSVSATADNSRVTEGSDTTVSITLTRTGSLSRSASIGVSTSTLNGGIDTDATPGEDYVGLSTVVEFQPNDNEETITITILDDENPEKTELLLVSLEEVDCSVSGDSRLIIFIDDDDETEVRMSTPKITVEEGNADGVAFVSIERSGSLSKSETVDLKVRPFEVTGTSDAATGNSDFDNRDISVDFEVDEDVVTAEIEIYDDTFEEGLESFVVEIDDLSSGSDATIDNDNRKTTVCIRDNDGTFRIAGDAQERSVSEGTDVIITISRSGDTSTEQTVYLTTNDIEATGNVDYETLNGIPVVFEPGVTSRTVTINTYDDQELEPRESFSVFLSSDNGNDLGQRAVFINIEDEDHEIHFLSVPGSTIIGNTVAVSESVGSVFLTLQREGYSNNLPAGIATVYVGARELSTTGISQGGVTPAEQDGSERDFEFTETTITFQSGQSRATVEVDIVDDETGENREAFEIYLSNAQPSADNKIVFPNTVVVNINDDDGGTTPDDGDGGQGGDGDGTQGGDGTTTLSRPLIVGLAGGVGLLILLLVLGFIAMFAFSRWRRSAPAVAAGPRARVVAAPRPVYQYPPQQPRRFLNQPPQRPNYYP